MHGSRTVKKYKVAIAFGAYRRGQIIEPTGLYRDMLLDSGYIEAISEEQDAPVEDAVVDAPAETAQPAKRKRGRPRKARP